MLGPRKYSIVLIGYFVLGLLLLLGLGDCHIIRVSLHVELIAWAVIEGVNSPPIRMFDWKKLLGAEHYSMNLSVKYICCFIFYFLIESIVTNQTCYLSRMTKPSYLSSSPKEVAQMALWPHDHVLINIYTESIWTIYDMMILFVIWYVSFICSQHLSLVLIYRL